MKKKYLAAGVIILLLAFLAVYISGNFLLQNEAAKQIAYVDMWELFENHPDKDEAEEELNQLAREMEAELTETLADVPEEEHQALIADYQQRIETREEELIEEVLTDIDYLIVQAAEEEEEVSLVLEKENVTMGGYDLTPRVIDLMDQ